MKKFIATLERRRTETAQVVVEVDALPAETLLHEFVRAQAIRQAARAQFSSEEARVRVAGIEEDMEDPFRDTCFFCRAKWGKCDCPWPSAATGGFKWNDIDITTPNVDETGRQFVDPNVYYGDVFTKWWSERGRFKGHHTITIPQCLLDAGFKDVSWKNDESACAHLELIEGRILVAWISAEKIEDRASSYTRRFALMIAPRQHYYDGDEATPVIETDDEMMFAEVVTLLARQSARLARSREVKARSEFIKALAAMDDAEGLHGPDGDDYLQLMEEIESEARRRREIYQAAIAKK